MMKRTEKYKNIDQIKKKEEKERKKKEKKERKLEKKREKLEQKEFENEKDQELEEEIKKKSKLKTIFKFMFLLIIIAIAYAYFIEPNILLVHDHILEESNIPSSFHGLKLVHFSDVHYGMNLDKKRLEEIVLKINKTNPDIILFTGDFVDETYSVSEDNAKEISAILNKLEAKYGKYAVFGNHDPDNSIMMNLFYDGGFRVLRNSYDLIYIDKDNPIAIYGFNPDLKMTNKIKIKEKAAYTIVLTHFPDLIDQILMDVSPNLILSGHSHNGQVKIPYLKPILLPDGCKKYYAPYYRKKNTKIYISNGIGTSVLPLRFASVPSFNVYRLLKTN